MDPLGAAIIGGINAGANLLGIAMGPQNSPAGIFAAQPSAVAAQQYGVFGGPAQAALATSSQAVFQNQSPWALAALSQDSIGAGVEGFAGRLVSNSLAPFSGSGSNIPWGTIAVIVVAVLLFKKVL